jgi:hypothetical protein
MEKCYFCGAKAPRMKKSDGKYILECKCGKKIEDYNQQMVIDLWNYKSNG